MKDKEHPSDQKFGYPFDVIILEDVYVVEQVGMEPS